MKQIELYVPICDNDGRRIEATRWDWLREYLAQHFGGFSKYLVDGFYRGQQRDYAESCFVYRIIGEIVDIEPIAEAVKKYWQQESVLYTISDVDAVFV